VPYISDTLKGKTKPHIYSWFIWGFVTLIAFLLQLSEGGGTGSFVTLAASFISFSIFFLGFKNGNKDIVTSDTVFFCLSLAAIIIWLLAKQPVISAILIMTIDILGFVPTVRKSWKDPHSETLPTYALNTVRHGIGLLALFEYNFITCLYPVAWMIMNGGFSIMLIVRRHRIGN
jgi:hypothetical protein